LNGCKDTENNKHLKISVADPDLGMGSGAFLTPRSGIRDEHPGSYFRDLETIFGFKYFGYGMEKNRIRDAG
jgi:hypothetical protein